MRYWSGFFAGITTACALAMFALGVIGYGQNHHATLGSLGAAELPLLTRVATHPAWIWGAPAGLLVVAMGLSSGNTSKRRNTLLAIFAAIAIVATLYTVWAPTLPFTELSSGL